MLRQTLLRSTLPSLKATTSRQAPTLFSLRNATTHAPTNASGPPPSEISQKFAPGEELDPQLNGYPQLPYVHFAQKPAKGWWDNQSRSNFNDTVHEEDDMLNLWAPDYQAVSGAKAAAGILAALSVFATIAYIVSFNVPELPAVRREYPYNGLEKELGGIIPARAEETEDDE